jgi:hypothetical protein
MSMYESPSMTTSFAFTWPFTQGAVSPPPSPPELVDGEPPELVDPPSLPGLDPPPEPELVGEPPPEEVPEVLSEPLLEGVPLEPLRDGAPLELLLEAVPPRPPPELFDPCDGPPPVVSAEPHPVIETTPPAIIPIATNARSLMDAASCPELLRAREP